MRQRGRISIGVLAALAIALAIGVVVGRWTAAAPAADNPPPHAAERAPAPEVATAPAPEVATAPAPEVVTSPAPEVAPPQTAPPASPSAHLGDRRVAALFASRRSGVFVEVSGVVTKRLPDDLKGSRHQRFLVGLASGPTLLVSHNIDLAPRVDDLAEGARVDVRGRYEWNARGGVVHWTHHDPKRRKPGGWIKHAGRTYR